MKVIKIKNINKKFKLYSKKREIINELIFGRSKAAEHEALKDVSFSIEKSLTYGIIGANGSGKSTLLRILNGNIYADSGTLNKVGKSIILSVGVGITDNYTGLQNIYYKCALFGLTNKQTNQIIDDIVDFSELGFFIEQPVSKYSSGMKAKLGFSIAIHLPFEILIIDEALAVGDEIFKLKCLSKIDEFKIAGKTIVFVSHSVSSIRQFCDKCCWLHQGELIAKGEVNVITELYAHYCSHKFDLKSIKELVENNKEVYYND